MPFATHVTKMRDFYQSLADNEPDRIRKMMLVMDDLLQSRDGKPPKMRPEDFSIQEIYQAVSPSAFPVITGKLISTKIMEAYESVPAIGEELTTKMTSKLEIDRIPGVNRRGSMVQVNPGGPYQHTGYLEEKWAQIVGKKYGEILDITEEAIMFDRTGLIMMRAATIGEDARNFKEKIILNTIQDVPGYKGWYPNTGPETVANDDLYQNAQGAGDTHEYDNLVTDALSVIDDLDAALYLLQTMKKDDGEPMLVVPRILLVPIKLVTTARRVLGPIIKGQSNDEPNPLAGILTIKSSPYMDAQSTTAWYVGDFKKQFIWKEVIPIQVLTRMDNTNDAAWERDIKAQYKVRMYGTCGATDYRYVVKSTGVA